MKQEVVTKRALSIIKKECLVIINSRNSMTLKKSFHKKAGDIVGISISGRTLRKIYNDEPVHVSTIERLIKDLNKEICIKNGKIDIKDEASSKERQEPQ